jgi:hydroxymethylbilane synthase
MSAPERGADLIAAAARTLSRMRTYIKTVVPPAQRGKVFHELARLPIERLAAMNPVEAEHETEEIIAATLRRAQGGSIPHHDTGDHHGTGDHHDTNPDTVLICASRASALAMTQTRAVAAKLARHGVATEILNITTTGDRVQDRSLVAIGAESLFVKELELALRDGRAQYAVHSCKDLPSVLPHDMKIAAISEREDPRDVFCSERYESFASLPPGARVGTSSLRRRAQLAALRGDLQYVDVRGNVDTRLRKLRDGQYDAIVLASAGLQRLGVRAKHTVPFDVSEIVPAVAQGALAVETRTDAAIAAQIREAINDTTTEVAVMCERAALRTLQGGCQAPIGIHARFEAQQFIVDGVIASLDGKNVLRDRRSGIVADVFAAEALGVELAGALLAAGASQILTASPRPQALPLSGKLVVLPRTHERASRIAAALRADGAEVVEVRTGDPDAGDLGQRIPDAIIFPSSAAVNAAGAYLHRVHRYERRPAVAAMGPSSSAAAHAAGFTPDIVAPDAEIDALIGALRAHLLSKEHS